MDEDRSHDAPSDTTQETVDARNEYEAPQLTDRGNVNEITLAGAGSGSDSGYS